MSFGLAFKQASNPAIALSISVVLVCPVAPELEAVVATESLAPGRPGNLLDNPLIKVAQESVMSLAWEWKAAAASTAPSDSEASIQASKARNLERFTRERTHARTTSLRWECFLMTEIMAERLFTTDGADFAGGDNVVSGEVGEPRPVIIPNGDVGSLNLCGDWDFGDPREGDPVWGGRAVEEEEDEDEDEEEEEEEEEREEEEEEEEEVVVEEEAACSSGSIGSGGAS